MITSISNINKHNTFRESTKRDNTRNSEKAKVVLNAINTVDMRTQNLVSQTDNANNTLILIPTLLCAGLSLGSTLSLAERSKNFSGKMFAGLTALGALIYSQFALKRGRDDARAYHTGVYEAIDNDLQDSKNFAILSQEQISEVKNNPEFKYYQEFNYEQSPDLMPDFLFLKHIKFLSALRKKEKSIDIKAIQNKNIQSDDNDKELIENLARKIDKETMDYSNKVALGLNYILAGAITGGLTLAAISGKAAKKSKSLGLGVKTAAIALCAVPFCMFGKLLNLPFFKNIEDVGRYKSKERIYRELAGQEALPKLPDNALGAFVEHMKTKNVYKTKIERLNQLTKTKNNIVKNMNFTDEQLQQGEALKNSFAASSKIIDSNERERHFKTKSFYRDFLFLTTVPITSILVNSAFYKKTLKTNFKKPLVAAAGLTGGAALLNTLFIKSYASKFEKQNQTLH